MFEQSKANSRHLDVPVPIDLPNREKAIRLWPMNGVSTMRGGKRYPHPFSTPIRDSTRMTFDSLGDLESISETVAHGPWKQLLCSDAVSPVRLFMFRHFYGRDTDLGPVTARNTSPYIL